MSSVTSFIGIDFGTSKCTMAWYNPRAARTEIVHNAEGEATTPSVVYFGTEETLVGRAAEEMIQIPDERPRVVASAKRELVLKPTIALPNRRVKPAVVVTEILRKLREDAEQGLFHQPVRHAVITYP